MLSLKVFCTDKSAKHFRCVIELFKCWACDAAHFESDMLYPRKLNFIHANSQGAHFHKVFLHADAKPRADAGPLKVKYPVNAENFQRYL